MTKDVFVSICGLHFTDDGQDPTELIVPGKYYFRNGKHYILYEEAVEGFREKIKSQIRVDDGGVEIIKRGVNNVHMDFRPGKKHLARYQTPYGPLLLGMQTHAVQIDEREDRLDVRLEYDLEVEGERLSACSLTMEVTPRGIVNI